MYVRMYASMYVCMYVCVNMCHTYIHREPNFPPLSIAEYVPSSWQTPRLLKSESNRNGVVAAATTLSPSEMPVILGSSARFRTPWG